jgi:pyruvate dehydrogenase E1 component alpha subunit
MVYYGDGAANQGQVYESFNMAALWKLPVVYVIENNRYGMGTSVARASATGELHKRGSAYGIPNEEVDGMDVLAVYEAGQRALAHARSGKGPYILGVQTYRYRGHSMSDPAKYRSREEVSKIRSEQDPIDRIRQMLLDDEVATEDEVKKIDADVKAIVTEAAEFAQQSAEPELSELYTDVLVEA